MNKLKELIRKTKCSITIEINDHRDFYGTIEKYVDEKEKKFIDKEVWNKMIELDSLVSLQFYPCTPIGSYRIHHYDVEKAIDQALEIIKQS